MDFGVDLYGPNWSGLSSAAALMELFARRTGAELTARQRARIVWEVEKYAPAFNEMPGTEIVDRATGVAQRTLGTAKDFGEFLTAGLHHGTRVLQRRDRATLTWAVSAAARTAAMERELDEHDCHFFHDVLHRSQGAYRVEGPFGSVELGDIDAIRHQKDPKGLEALLVPADANQSRMRVSELAKRPGLPPAFSWKRGHSFAFLTCAALNVDNTAAADPKAVKLEASFHEKAPLLGFSDTPLTDDHRRLARAAAEQWSPNDPSLFLRSFEDHLAFFVDLDRERLDLLLKLLNALVADAAPITAYRRELITVAMAVLALGRSAEWRRRAAPPPAVYD